MVVYKIVDDKMVMSKMVIGKIVVGKMVMDIMANPFKFTNYSLENIFH
jgi:hypothetical protein